MSSLSWGETLQLIKESDPRVESIDNFQFSGHIRNMSDEEWEDLGRDIANNTHLTALNLHHGALNNHKISFLCRGLTRSNMLKRLDLCSNNLSTLGVRSMVPFLQNANRLTNLDLGFNNIQSEGFNVLFRALNDSPIQKLHVNGCGIASIEIDIEHAPRYLKDLFLDDNNISVDGCRGLARLLMGDNATLESLSLRRNQIDDNGVELLVDALKSNSSLKELYLLGNTAITKRGKISLLKLVNDISSIEATLQSNHTLTHIYTGDADLDRHFRVAMEINMDHASNPEAAGWEKVIETQLHHERRVKLAALQGVYHSVYSEIDPLCLPEVFVSVGRHHGQGHLYVALRSSIAGVISTVNKKECLKQQSAYYEAKMVEYKEKMETVNAEIAAIEAAEEIAVSNGCESRSSKKRRAC